MDKYQKICGKLLSKATIEINGNRPWDIQVKNSSFYKRVLAGGSLALGESYMDGWWDCDHLDEFFCKIIGHELHKTILSKNDLLYILMAKVTNRQNKKRAEMVADKHYNLSRVLYKSFLDPYNQYTCGYWKDTQNLHSAQEAKLDLICKKLQLKQGDRLLDMGCGWGGLAKFAAEKYGVSVVGINISDEQVMYATEHTKGLPVEIRKQDYRDFDEKIDKVAVVGMIEHVGPQNYAKLMKIINKCLNDDGLFLLHTIGGKRTKSSMDPWFDKYIFPNAVLPSIKQLSTVAEEFFILEDLHNFGSDYDKTLMAWDANFTKNWNNVEKYYDERFYRMWRYYLLSSAGFFRARHHQLWQVVFSKNGVVNGYNSIR